jgi:hypothetical protein
MLKLFWKNFKIAFDNIILSAPLIIFVSIISCYLNFAKDFENTVVKAVFTIITTVILISAFFCVWFYIVKKIIKLTGKEFVYNNDRTNALKEILKSIPKGFSKYFLPFIGITSTAMLFFLICYNFVDYNLPTKIVDLFEHFSKEHIDFKSIIIFISISFLSFWGLLWIPEVIYGELNPFKALVYSIKKIFITLPQSILLYLYIYILFTIMHYAVVLLMSNPFLYFIVLLLYYYFTVYVTTLLFRYYEEKFLK